MSESEFSAADLSGRIVDRRFEVVDKLGEGGMGAIYRAKQLSVNRMVALKLLLRDRRGDPISAERFKHEAYLASRLRHPNAVVIYDFGQADDGLLYIAMELLTGQNLKECMQNDGPLGHNRGARIMLQTLRPIGQAHGMGLVHRDLKPANIFLTEVEGDKDFVKVLDFGVAKLTAVQDSVEGYQGGLTVAGKIYGTPNYMSPEQIRGKDVDQLSDLYSLGIIFYEMLCGRRPFEAETPVDVMMMHLRDDPLPPSAYEASIPPTVDAIALKALAKEPADRYPNAEAFIEALNGLGVTSGAFGTLASERSDVPARGLTQPNLPNDTSLPVEDGASEEIQGEEISITGLGFSDDDFGDEYQDEKTVLEVEDSIEVDFSVSVSDIESESLDQGHLDEDTLFQSAADDSIKALFEQIEPEPANAASFDNDDSSQLEALDVDGDDFGSDEPSRLVPIPVPKPSVNRSSKNTKFGYAVEPNSGDSQGLESPFSSPPPGVPSEQPNPAVKSSDIMSTQFGAPKPTIEKAPYERVEARSTLDERPNPVVDSAQPSAQRRSSFDSDTKTPNPGNVESWAAAFSATPNVSQANPRFAIPDAPPKGKSQKKIFVGLGAVMLLAAIAVGGYLFLTSETPAPPSISLNNPAGISAKFDVFVAGHKLDAKKSSLAIADAEEKQALVKLKTGGAEPWAFTLPTIVEPTELLLRLEEGKTAVGMVRIKRVIPGADVQSTLQVDGESVKSESVIVIGSVGMKLKAVRNGKEKEFEIFGGETLQDLREF